MSGNAPATPSSRLPRVPRLPAAGFADAEVAAALRLGLGEAGASRYLEAPESTPNVLAVMLQHPRVAGPFLRYNFTLLGAPTLDPLLRELAILRVAWHAQAQYEWLQHVRLALGAGLSSSRVAAIGEAIDGSWSLLESAVLHATDELLHVHRVSDDTWTALATHLDQRSRMELVYVVGTYVMLAMAFNTFGVETDPDLAEVAATHPLPARHAEP